MFSKKDEDDRAARRWGRVVLGAVVTLVVAPLVVIALTPWVSQWTKRLGSQLDYTVQLSSDTGCDFVVPVESIGLVDPSQLALQTSDLPAPGGEQSKCESAIEGVRGVHDRLVLEVIVEPTGDDSVVLTDVTIDVRETRPNSGSASYSPFGTGGGSTMMQVLSDVESSSPVQSVITYPNGVPQSFESVRSVVPRLSATKSDPLNLLLEYRGHKLYSTFDVVLHWQSGVEVGTTRLDNDGAGYEVAGIEGIPRLEGYDGHGWKQAP
ncbi:hypothetical protein SK224_07440 [Microbacterium sp. BG28]|uniref:hypothetical protein n=1 Tax=Microbacterium sp. BG28 TaxID=3097356 RepID=UPI002A59C61F|nr:hypothetical protein [Microbacterium sp. BG28]MDY0828958.1 hypothetical protein [Microbacterium sp. BG28]